MRWTDVIESKQVEVQPANQPRAAKMFEQAVEIVGQIGEQEVRFFGFDAQVHFRLD